ncbi:unnamed protein product [marine sediment metagenome]|uniref:Uncharacterized protein n=1 Tax=marine sediment metagenome TaxID=412755 RepID=X1MLI9_9ZZZZ
MNNQKSTVLGLLGLGLMVLTGSVVIALDQLITWGGWETEQTFHPFHHEGIAIYGVIIGTVLVGAAALKEGEG